MIKIWLSEKLGKFFAVVSETVVKAPDLVRQAYLAAYALMSSFYRQNPAERTAAEPGLPEEAPDFSPRGRVHWPINGLRRKTRY